MVKSDLDRIRHIAIYCNDIAATIKRFGDSFEVFHKIMIFITRYL